MGNPTSVGRIATDQRISDRAQIETVNGEVRINAGTGQRPPSERRSFARQFLLALGGHAKQLRANSQHAASSPTRAWNEKPNSHSDARQGKR